MAKLLNFLQKVCRLSSSTAAQIQQPPCIPKRTVLFYRDFRGFTGGHLKVWHYFNHVLHAPGYQPQIAFSAETLWDRTNPWLPIRDQALAQWSENHADLLFLAGMDWSILSKAQRHSPPKPIINLIQHVRHSDPKEALYQYLRYRAVRICVSESVTEALQATGQVNGPLFTIPNGIDVQELPLAKLWEERDVDILIVGIKQPTLAIEIATHLETWGQRITALTAPIPRAAFIELINNAKISLFLPHKTEGFYLPALEGFAVGTLVICPDCIGNRSFCLPSRNCLQPPSYTTESLLETLRQALHLLPKERFSLLDAARRTAQQHTLLEERQAFLKILEQIEAL